MLTLSIIALTLSFQSCNNDSKEAKITNQAKQEAVSSKEANTYKVDTLASKITWEGGTLASKHLGTIILQSGELKLKDSKIESGSFTANMNTISTTDIPDPEKAKLLNNHLKNEDFFDVSKFPSSKFVITLVKPIESGEYNVELEGNLEVKGITKNLSVKANVKAEGDKVTLKTEKFTINRQEFNITYSNGEPQDKLIKDLLDISVDIVANKEAN
ncbi:YceI family protein [Apibacter muscae]|uniref:YceI family protein n=1 Tax=Apibacter muscae TaxID=2509004 RepID=A0A563DDC9_9FLAO|nr:YceI family protein [Apibacter muscae]TWP30731.1 YceI family protein [Apibacter muscae]